jgi:hypothetical protein
MPKPRTNAQRAFLKAMDEMTSGVRHDIDEPFALIGKATHALLRDDRPVTDSALAEEIARLANSRNADAVKRALSHLGLPPEPQT